MAHSTKRSRSDSFDDTTWQKPLTMIENLQGSTAKLTSTLNKLSSSVELLDNLVPSMRRFSTMAQMERKYEMVTDQDIKGAQAAVANETMPEIELLLAEAQILIDQEGVEALEMARKVNRQGKAFANSHPSPSTALNEGEEEKKLAEAEKRIQWCQSRQQALEKESNDLDDTLAALKRELAQLDVDLASSQKATAAAATTVDPIIKQNVVVKSDADLLEEEAQLMKELESIRAQQKEQQRQQRQQQQQQQQQRMMTEKKRKEMDQAALTGTMTKDDCAHQLAIMQEFMDYLRKDTGVPSIDVNDLRTYLATLEQEKNKIPPPSDLETRVTNNRELLKTYCKNVLPNKNMGFVAQRVVDKLFTDEGYKAYTQQEFLGTFDSPRQKDLVKQFLDRYTFITHGDE